MVIGALVGRFTMMMGGRPSDGQVLYLSGSLDFVWSQ